MLDQLDAKVPWRQHITLVVHSKFALHFNSVSSQIYRPAHNLSPLSQSQLKITLYYNCENHPKHLWDIYLENNVSYFAILDTIKPYHDRRGSGHATCKDTMDDGLDLSECDASSDASDELGWVIIAPEDRNDEQWVCV